MGGEVGRVRSEERADDLLRVVRWGGLTWAAESSMQAPGKCHAPLPPPPPCKAELRPEFQGICHLGASRVIVLIRGQNRAPRGTRAQFLTISLLLLGLQSSLQRVRTVPCGSRGGAVRCGAGRGISCDGAPGPGEHRTTQDRGGTTTHPRSPKVTERS